MQGDRVERQLSATLRRKHHALWTAAQEHPFVQALADGSLDRARFVHFLEQDYVYLQAYARAVSLAAAKAPGLQLLSEFSALAHETLATEMRLHRDYCTQFGITAGQLESVAAAPVCQAYADFSIATAATSSCAGLLAALIPCGVGYAEIGTRLAPLKDKAGHPYRQWIAVYAGAEYQAYAAWMARTFDTLATDAARPELSAFDQLFVLGCRYEWLFWEMAWTLDRWPEIESS